MMRRSITPFILTTLLTTLPTTLILYSQTTLANEDDEMFNSLSLADLLNVEVVTASRTKESADRAPGTLVVVPRQQITDRGYRNLADVLKDLPGIDYAHAQSSTSYNLFTIRGVQGNNKFVILQNGQRISSPTGEHIPIMDNFPLYHVKQIEIVYGPASALYGADAFTGVINLITDTQDTATYVNIEAGSDNHSYSHFQTGFQWGERVNIRLGGHYQTSDHSSLIDDYEQIFTLGDLQTFSGETIINAKDRVMPHFPTLSHSINLEVTLDEQLSIQYRDTSFRNATSIGDRPNHTDYGRHPTWYTDLSALSGQYQLQINDSWSTTLQASYNVYEIDPRTKFANTFVNFVDGYKYGKSIETEFGQQFFYQYNSDTNIVLGYVLERFDSQPKGADLLKPYNPNQPADNQGLYYQGTDDTLPVKVFRIKYDSHGAFGQIRTRWSEQLSSVVGMRYDKSSTYGSTSNPRAGLIYQAKDDWTVKLLYGEAFLAPSPRTTYEHFGSFAYQRDDGLYQSFFFHIPNPNVKPEKMKTLELNSNWRVSDNFNITATLYQEKVDNMIGSVITNPPVSDFITGGNITTTEISDNIGAIDAQGLDIAFIYQQSVGQGTLQIFGNSSFVDGDLTAPGIESELPFTARTKIKLGLTYRQSNWFITPTLYRIGATSGPSGSGVENKTPSYTLVNVYGGVNNIVNQINVYARINNLLNKRHYHPGNGSDFVLAQRPQDLRTFEVGLNWKF